MSLPLTQTQAVPCCRCGAVTTGGLADLWVASEQSQYGDVYSMSVGKDTELSQCARARL